jgi:signal transduction histidine kinase
VDGERITVASHWNLHLDSDGKPAAILQVNLDITQRKEAERQVALLKDQLSEELNGMRSLHELGPRLMALDDLPSLLGEILAAAREITGAEMGNIQLIGQEGALRIEVQHGFGKEFLDFFNDVHEDDAATSGEALARRERTVVEDVEKSPLFAGTAALKVLLAAGVRAMQSTPLITHAGILVGVLSTHYRRVRRPSERDLRLLDLLTRQAADLIAKKQSEDHLLKANEDLARANEDLNQFAFAASHDLQEPLRMITSYSQLLVKGYRGQLDDEASTCIQFITDGTKRIRELLADLLAYTLVANNRQEVANPIDLNQVFQRVLENCKATIEETRATVTSDRLPTVQGRDPYFIQLLQNLISNGLKYRAANRPPRVHVSAEAQKGMWRLAVKDNGIGIDPAYHKQIFGVFKRLHGRTIPGTGIGLAICQRVIDRYGGKIWVESQTGQGATFYFTLPAAEKGSAAAHD